MRYKTLAFILALTIASWAQTTTPSQTPDSGKTTAAAGPCGDGCAKMASADHKDGHSCMHHAASAKDAKETASCGSGKDAASCSAGKDGKSCAKDDKTSASCCGGKPGHGPDGLLLRQRKQDNRKELLRWRAV
jgi:hypothetical protein